VLAGELPQQAAGHAFDQVVVVDERAAVAVVVAQPDRPLGRSTARSAGRTRRRAATTVIHARIALREVERGFHELPDHRERLLVGVAVGQRSSVSRDHPDERVVRQHRHGHLALRVGEAWQRDLVLQREVAARRDRRPHRLRVPQHPLQVPDAHRRPFAATLPITPSPRPTSDPSPVASG